MRRPAAGRVDGVCAADRIVDWYLASATAAEAIVSPSHRTLARDYCGRSVHPAREFEDDAQALGWLDQERDRLADVLRWSAERGRNAAAWQLADAMWPLFLRLRPARLWVEAHRVGLRAARADGDRLGELRMLTSGGNGLRNAGESAEAAQWFTEALDLARELAHPLAQADALYGLSQTHRVAGRLDEAAACLRQVVHLRESEDYVRGSALARLAYGEVLLTADRAVEAVGPIERAYHELSSIRDDYEAARAMAFLGLAHGRLGAFGRAEACIEEALTGFRARLSVHWEARTLEFAGEVEEWRGRPAAARTRFEQSLARYQEVGAAAEAARLAGRLAAYGVDSAVTPDPATREAEPGLRRLGGVAPGGVDPGDVGQGPAGGQPGVGQRAEGQRRSGRAGVLGTAGRSHDEPRAGPREDQHRPRPVFGGGHRTAGVRGQHLREPRDEVRRREEPDMEHIGVTAPAEALGLGQVECEVLVHEAGAGTAGVGPGRPAGGQRPVADTGV